MKINSNPLKKTHAKCIICENKLQGKQTKFCSKKCKLKDTNNRHQNYECQQNRGRTRKIKLVQISGGECKICGYDKNYAALTFHHLNPENKKFGIDLRSCSNRTWKSLQSEVAKCELLCIRCHVEIHNPDFFV